MTQDAYLLKSSEPEEVDTFIKFTGAGAAPVVKVAGKGVTITRTGVGLVSLIFDEFAGVYLGVKGFCFEATVAAGVKGYTVVPGVYNTATRTLAINMTSAAEALVDLAALQQLSLTLAFKRVNV
jgi:hypothetical protein